MVLDNPYPKDTSAEAAEADRLAQEEEDAMLAEMQVLNDQARGRKEIDTTLISAAAAEKAKAKLEEEKKDAPAELLEDGPPSTAPAADAP